MPNNLRYTPGNVYLFIRTKYVVDDPSVNYCTVYIPWLCSDLLIETVRLLCIEHHRVPGDWSDEIKYDGFTFVDDSGAIWINQFPRASYGQVDDSADRKVSRAAFVPEDNLWSRWWTDGPTFINEIKKGEELPNFSPSEVAQLRSYRGIIELTIKRDYGRKVVHGFDDIKSISGDAVFKFPTVSFEPPL